jgi:hypothetical protein
MTSVIKQPLNGLKMPQTLSENAGLTMVIRGSTYYAFSSYREFSVFSCESHLSWQLFFSRRNLAALWNLQGGRIRISILSVTDLYSPNLDTLRPMIGATLSLMRNSNREQFCDYCKLRYTGSRGELHRLAKNPAYWKVVSQAPGRQGRVRFYCLRCADQIQNWEDGTFFSLKEQLEAEINQVKGEYFNDKLAE